MTPEAALQQTLAAEHAATYVYGVVGARTSATATPALFAAVTAAYRTHRDRRDEVAALLRELEVEPVPAAPVYATPARLDTAAQVTRAARELERSCAQMYAAQVAASDGAARAWAVIALGDAAVRQLDFGGRPEAFPGAPDLAEW